MICVLEITIIHLFESIKNNSWCQTVLPIAHHSLSIAQKEIEDLGCCYNFTPYILLTFSLDVATIHRYMLFPSNVWRTPFRIHYLNILEGT